MQVNKIKVFHTEQIRLLSNITLWLFVCFIVVLLLD